VVADGRLSVEGEQISVAPDARGARRDPVSGDDLLDRLVVIVDLERAETELADVNRGDRVGATTLPAVQTADVRRWLHQPGPPGDLSPTRGEPSPDETDFLYHATRRPVKESSAGSARAMA